MVEDTEVSPVRLEFFTSGARERISPGGGDFPLSTMFTASLWPLHRDTHVAAPKVIASSSIIFWFPDHLPLFEGISCFIKYIYGSMLKAI